MIRNATARFYIGIVFHLVGAAALVSLGIRTGQALAFVAAGLLFAGTIAAAYFVRRELHDWPPSVGFPPTAAPVPWSPGPRA
jgi:hypothetical protein